MEVSKITPDGKMRIDFSEKVQGFDFFKKLDIDE